MAVELLPALSAGDRLQKVLAHAGLASRRAAEEMILAGRVSVNGEVVRELGRRVVEADCIEVDGRGLERAERQLYVALNKPLDYVSTVSDPRGRPTVVSLVQRPERIYPVGRLDWDTEGLLLLSNDGLLTHRLTHPRYGIEKQYHALASGYPSVAALRRLADGVELDDGWTAPADVVRMRQDGQGVWLSITLHEGRNRQVRRMLQAVGHAVKRLVRVRFGPVELGDLTTGQSRELTSAEIAALRSATEL